MKEDTWTLIENELEHLQRKYSEEFFVLMGDFNTSTSEEPEIPLVSLSGKDLTSLRIPESYKIPRRSQDVKRKVSQWGRRLLGIFREFGLVIGNGRFGNDAGRGEFTCVSGTNFSVIDYVLVDSRLAPISLNLEVVHFAGSDHFPLIFYFQSTNISKNQWKREKLKYQTFGTGTSSTGLVKSKIQCEWVEKDVTRIKDYFCSEPMVQQLNALACEIEENTGNVNEVSSKFAELIRSPLLEKMRGNKKARSSTMNVNGKKKN